MDTTYRKARSAQAMGTLALVIGLVSLVIAISAFNRTGQNLEEVIAEGVQDIATGTVNVTAEALTAISDRLRGGEPAEDLAEDLAEARTDIRNAYVAVGRETSEGFQQVDAQLEEAETALEQGSADALQQLQEAINALENDLRTENA
jgi:hypothetical protein